LRQRQPEKLELPKALDSDDGVEALGIAIVSRPGGVAEVQRHASWTAKTMAEGRTRDLFYTLNRETAGNNLGLTLQTGCVTKSLLGLSGSEKFRLAVSADCSSFSDGLIVHNTNGIVDQPRLPRFKGYNNFDRSRPGRRSPSTPPSTATRARSMPPTTDSWRRWPRPFSSGVAALQDQLQHDRPDERPPRP
jgi:hypothetical protein